ncbi:MAG TPA: hypothetical protein VGB63_01175 [Pedobacter sp.]|jgi:hypothetical protein
MPTSLKKKILLLILITVSTTIQAQIRRIDTVTTSNINLKTTQSPGQQQYLYSIGVKAFSIEEFPKILNQINSDMVLNTYMSGVILKVNDNQISYRLSANFFKKDMSFDNECEGCEQANGNLKDFSTKIGFEKNFIYGVVQPYLAFDLGYRRTGFKGDVKSPTIASNTNPYKVTTLKNGFLMSPGFGVKLNLINHLTLSVETGVGLLYSYEKQEKDFENKDLPRTSNSYNKWEFLLKPVSMATIQYNFGSTF